MRLKSIVPDDQLFIQIRPTLITLVKKINGVWTVLDSQAVTTTEDQWYTLRAEYEGSDVTVWRSTDGELETEILTTSSAEPTTSSLVALSVHDSGGGATAYEFDNVRVLADDLSTTTTFTINNADELVSSATTYGGTTYYEYDAWGRMTRKYMGTSGAPTFDATYDYKYDDKLTTVTSNFPDEGNVSYTYGADGHRRACVKKFL